MNCDKCKQDCSEKEIIEGYTYLGKSTGMEETHFEYVYHFRVGPHPVIHKICYKCTDKERNLRLLVILFLLMLSIVSIIIGAFVEESFIFIGIPGLIFSLFKLIEFIFTKRFHFADLVSKKIVKSDPHYDRFRLFTRDKYNNLDT